MASHCVCSRLLSSYAAALVHEQTGYVKRSIEAGIIVVLLQTQSILTPIMISTITSETEKGSCGRQLRAATQALSGDQSILRLCHFFVFLPPLHALYGHRHCRLEKFHAGTKRLPRLVPALSRLNLEFTTIPGMFQQHSAL